MIVLTRALEDEMMECYKRVGGRREGADGGDFYLYESNGFSSMILLTIALEDEMMECYKRAVGRKEGADGGDLYLYENPRQY